MDKIRKHQKYDKQESLQFINKVLNSIIDELFLSKKIYGNLEIIKFENDKEIENSKLKLEEYFFTDICIENSNFKIIKNCRQLRGYLCGYHTIFNINNYIKFFKMKNSLEKENFFYEKNYYFYLLKANNRCR
jgi:hypothetical protein